MTRRTSSDEDPHRSDPALHDTGSGPAVLFLHAFPLDASQWDHQVAALSGRYRCLRPDFWGCGSSPPPPEDSSLDAYAAAVVRVLDERSIDRFAVVGLSLGGYVAMRLLDRSPERVRALVLADTRAGADTEETRAQRATNAARAGSEGVEFLVESTVTSLLSPASRAHPHISDPIRGRIRRWSPEGIAACLEAMAGRPDSTALLSAADVPALILVGEDDQTSTPDSMAALAASTRRAELHTIEGAGHLSNLEQPFAFTGRLEAFLDAADV